MDPSRIRLEDDRFGLIGASFRPQNRATFRGKDNDDYVWSIGIVIGDEDEIQTVEVDEHGAKSSRMLTPGEIFEGLEILATPGPEAYLVVGALTLLGMDLRTTGPEVAHEFAEILRSAADDRSWRLPLHLIGQPRDLQLSAQGRDILRQTAATLEHEGEARTSLAAAQRLELSGTALDSIRRRIARKSLQAYRMHGRWYVVLDNLARSRASEQNGTAEAATPAHPAPQPSGSPFEESQVGVEPMPVVPEEAEVEEPFVSAEEEQPAVSEAPTEDELTAFVADGLGVEAPEVKLVAPEETPAAEELPVAPGESGPSLQTEAVMEAEAAREELEREAAPETFPEETAPHQPAEQPEAETRFDEEVTGQPESAIESTPEPADQVISETILEEFIVTEIDAFLREQQPVEPEHAAATPAEEVISSETPGAEQPEGEVSSERLGEEDEPEFAPEAAEQTGAVAAEQMAEPEAQLEGLAEEPAVSESSVIEPSVQEEAERLESEMPPAELALEEQEVSAEGEVSAADGVDESVVSEAPAPARESEAEAENLMAQGLPAAATEYEAEAVTAEPAPPVADEAEVIEESETFAHAEQAEQPVAREELLTEGEAEPAEAALEEQLGQQEETEPAAVEPEEQATQYEDAELTKVAPGEPAAEPEEVEAGAEEAEEAQAAAPEAEEAQTVASEAEEAAEPSTSEQVQTTLNLLGHLRDEVEFLRQQGQEKDRQIVAWINGAQWLQPFVDQIRALEQQVERLGELQAKRDAERIVDLIAERDRLRERMGQLESEMATRTAAPRQVKNRSWFSRMMGSD